MVKATASVLTFPSNSDLVTQFPTVVPSEEELLLLEHENKQVRDISNTSKLLVFVIGDFNLAAKLS